VRELILSEIQRLAAENEGRPPGKTAFFRATGIAESKWSGVFWARWSDALIDAGFKANVWNPRLQSESLIERVAEFVLRLGRLPTAAEMKLERRRNPSFPNASTLNNHFRTKRDLIDALRLLAADEKFLKLTLILPTMGSTAAEEQPTSATGVVYLLKSGLHYKIGRSDNLERRVREVSIALPDKLVLVHSIKTDDSPGIEAYWHNRFKEKRVNGEWFKLAPSDVRIFVKRTFQ